MTKDIGILFSGKLDNVKDAVEHLQKNKELYWTTTFNIKFDKLSFPVIGLLHVKGDKVRYKCNIIDIKPFSPSDYNDSLKKPDRWRVEYRNDPTKRKVTLIINKMINFDYDTKELVKVNGETVKNPPQTYIKVFIP